MRHLLTLHDLRSAEVKDVFELSDELRSQRAGGDFTPRYPGRVLGLLFAKPSLRTRVSFEAAITHLGGSSLYLGKDVGWGQRESDADFNRVLTQYVDAIVCRTGDHDIVVRMASESACPVINGLTSLAHPCQALADLYTARETWPDLTRVQIAYVGDGNNVARSLALGCCHTGAAFVLAAPLAYQFSAAFLQQLDTSFPQHRVRVTDDPRDAVSGSQVVYTDVWSSMGQEAEHEERQRAFASFQVDSQLMKQAPRDAQFMHCLPARRGEEVTNDVIDGTQSVVVRQAANRMHVQKGVLAWLLDQSHASP